MPPSADSKGAIIAAIISGVFVIVAAIISGLFLLESSRIKEQSAATATAIAQITLPPLPTLTLLPTYTPLPTYTSYPTQTPFPTQTPRIVVATVAVSPTMLIVVPTPLPLGNAIIGALKNDGSVAAQSHETYSIALYPKTLLDATGQLHGDRNKRVYAFPDRQTGLAVFTDLTPGVYVVCFTAPGGSVTVGEITIKPYVTVRQNFRWPPSWPLGSDCKL